jgi:hypothetical protein
VTSRSTRVTRTSGSDDSATGARERRNPKRTTIHHGFNGLHAPGPLGAHGKCLMGKKYRNNDRSSKRWLGSAGIDCFFAHAELYEI